MKNINKIISGIIFSLTLLGTSKVDASLRRKLEKRKPKSIAYKRKRLMNEISHKVATTSVENLIRREKTTQLKKSLDEIKSQISDNIDTLLNKSVSLKDLEKRAVKLCEKSKELFKNTHIDEKDD